ncbi:XkdF-like putative serine protease domain-containing protein [Campylobacter anatolicus]|uniref:XkdF-like putative serine protease domain-containing protein n=1 Tax=Campylobacter anatolicus TaxID=2829105 RepID=UPI001E52195E|nr:XkdF-like putative serine protease domain-containing protein [Campylobacter anatolicus]
MSKEITNMQIKLISLVSAGVNNKKIIYKNENFNELLRVDFKKSDDEQGVVYGIVYVPDEVDTQGDCANANEIKKAAYNFMKRADLGYCVDVNHDFNITNAYICESWIVKSKDEFFSEIGAWAVGIKLEDEDLKQMVKNGAITGLSMYGSGIIKSAEPDTTKGGVMAVLKEFFGSSENLKK